MLTRTLRKTGLGLFLVLIIFGTILYTRPFGHMRAYAVANTEINFQARLLNNSGAIVADSNTYSVEFNLYNVASGGTTQWTETQSGLTVKSGYLSVHLGTVTPFPSTIDWTQKQWLTMNVNSDGEMNPRLQLTAVPLALRSIQADGITNGASTLTANNLAQLAPGTPQVINSALAALRLNQTGAGALFQLQNNGSDVFGVANNGDLTSSGSGTFSGGTLNLGTASQLGGLVLSDGSSNTGIVRTAALGQNTTYTLPDPGGASATICLNTGNCGGTGDISQGGNAFGAPVTIGSNDSQVLNFETNNITRLTIDTSGNANLTGTLTAGTGLTITAGGINNNSGGITNAGSITGVGTNITAAAGLTIASTGANNLILNSGSGVAVLGATTFQTADDLTLDLAKATDTTLLVQNSGAGVASLNISDGALQIAGTTVLTNGRAAQNLTGITSSGAITFSGLGAGLVQSSSGGVLSSGAVDRNTATFFVNALNVANGGTGAGTFTANGVLYGNGTSALGVTAAGTTGQCLVATTSSAPSWGSCAGTGSGVTLQNAYNNGSTITTADAKDLSFTLNDTTTDSNFLVNIATGSSSKFAVQNNGADVLRVTSSGTVINTGGLSILAGGANITGTVTLASLNNAGVVHTNGSGVLSTSAVVLGTDTSGSYVTNLGTLTGLSVTGNSGAGSTPALSVLYGSGANNAAAGSNTFTCASGTGNLSGGGTVVTIGTSGTTCAAIDTINNPTFSGLLTASKTGATAFAVTGAPVNSATSSLLQIGLAIASGNAVTDGGTYLGLNAPGSAAGSAADFLNFQANGTSKLLVSNAGNIITSGTVQYASGTADTNALVCRNNAGQLAACSSGALGGTAFIQGGNTFSGTTAGDLGTNNNGALNFRTNNATKLTLDTAGGLTFNQSSTIGVASAGTANTLSLVGGVATTGNNNGGSVTIQGGTPAGSGSYGDLLLQTNGGNVGIGQASTGAKLYVLGNTTATSGITNIVNIAGAQSVANTGSVVGLNIAPTYTAASGNTLAVLYGVLSAPQNTSTGTISQAFGLVGVPQNTSTGTITSAYGLYGRVDNSTTGTIGTAYGSYIGSPINNGTMNNKYALVTEANAGNVGIGTITPTARLHVNTGADATIGLILRQNSATQSGDLLQLQKTDGSYIGAIQGDGVLNLGQVAGSALSVGTNTIGDKINLWGSGSSLRFGIGIQAGTLVANVGSAASSFAVRVDPGSGQASSGTNVFSVNGSGNGIFNGTLAVNGNALSSTSGAFTLLSAPTTVTAFGAATTLGLGTASGTTTINGNTLTSTAFTFGGAGASSIQAVSGQNLTVQSQGAGGLTLTSGSGTINLGSNTVQRVNSSLSIDISNAGLSTLNIGNSNGSNLANIDISGGIFAGNGNAFSVNSDGDITSVFTVLNGTSTANGGSGLGSSTSLTLTSAANFDIGNYVQMNSANCGGTGINPCYAKITNKAGNVLTITPALTWVNGSTVNEYHIPELGGIDSSQTLINRYGRGYFIAGVATGNGTTYYNENSIETSLTSFDLLNSGVTTLNIGAAATTLNIGNSGGTTTIAGTVAFSGDVTAPSAGTSGYFARSGTTLSPANSGDNISTSGNLVTTGSGTITSAGLVTSVGLTAGSGLIQNTGGLTSTGSISLNASASTNTTNIGTGTTSGQITIGGGSTPLVINSTNFDVSSAGALSGITTINASGLVTSVGLTAGAGLIQGTAGLTITGAAVSLNATSNFAVNIGTGTTNATISIGGGSAPLSINSTAFDVSTAGALSGITTIVASGNINTTAGVYQVNSVSGLTIAACTAGQYIGNGVAVAGGIITAGSCRNDAGISDIRVKKDITSVGSVVDKLKDLNVVTFNFKVDELPELNLDHGLQYGVIAQQLEQVFPELVNLRPDGYKEVNFQGLNFYNLKAVTEISQHLDSQGNSNLTSVKTGGMLRLDNNGALQNITGLNVIGGGASLAGGLNNTGGGITNTGSITGATAIGAQSITLDAGQSGNLLSLNKDGAGIFTVFNNGALELRLDANNAFAVKNKAGDDVFTINTSGGLVQIGSGTSDDRAILLVLDSKNTVGDPAGVNGAQYYNANSDKFRCYQDGHWQDCLAASYTEYVLNSLPQSWMQPDTEQEFPGKPRTFIDLSNAKQFRLVVTINHTGISATKCRLQYALSDVGPWADLTTATGAGAMPFDSSGTVKGNWYDVVTDARKDVMVRIMCKGTNNVTTNNIGSVRAQVR